MSVTSLIIQVKGCLQWQSLRSYKNRVQPHLCLDAELHSWLETSPTYPLLPLPCLSPALGPVLGSLPYKYESLARTKMMANDQSISEQFINKRCGGASHLKFFFFFNWGNNGHQLSWAHISLFHMSLVLTTFTFGIFLFKNKTGNLKCCSAQNNLFTSMIKYWKISIWLHWIHFSIFFLRGR